MTVGWKPRETLEDLFAEPSPDGIAWRDIEALFIALGGMVTKGSTARVWVRFPTTYAVFHRSCQGADASRPQVRDVRRFLVQLGVEP